ncbi:MAG: hypothetical protein RXR06_10560 [Thermoproteus sp.]
MRVIEPLAYFSKDYFDLGSIEAMRFELVEARFIIYASSEMVFSFSDSSSYFSYVLSAYKDFILISRTDVASAIELKLYDALSGVDRIVETSHILKTSGAIDRNDRRREVLFALPSVAAPQGEDILAGFHRLVDEGEGPTTTGAVNLVEQMPMSLV